MRLSLLWLGLGCDEQMSETSDLGIDDPDATRFYMQPTSQALLSLVAQAMLIVYVEYATLFPPVGPIHVRARGKGAIVALLWRVFLLLPLPVRGPIAFGAGISYLVVLLVRLGRMCDGRADFVFSHAGVASTGVLFHRFLPWAEITEIERRSLWSEGSIFTKRRLVAHRFVFRIRRETSIRLVSRFGFWEFLGAWMRGKIVINTGFDQISVDDLDAVIARYAGEGVRVTRIGD